MQIIFRGIEYVSEIKILFPKCLSSFIRSLGLFEIKMFVVVIFVENRSVL